jgi:arylsulfatase A-like enzyme
MDFYVTEKNKKLVEKYMKEAKEKGVDNVKDYVRKYFKPTTESADVPDDAYPEGQFANNALRYMRQFSKEDKPFFLSVGFRRPHLPFVAPKKYWDLYQRDEVPLAPYQKPVKNGVDLAYHTFGEMRNYSDIPDLNSFSDIFSDLLPESKQRELVHGYHAAVSYVDAQVGKLMAELEVLGLKENTVIVLWGDHGWHLGDHALWCKHSNFENAARVPLLCSVPGVPSGRYDHPVELLDVFPTLCAATDLKIPEQLQGINLIPAMNDLDAKVKEYAVSQYRRNSKMRTFGYSIRNDRYRLTLWMKDFYRLYEPFDESYIIAAELYDYEKDPLETENFYDDKAYSEVRSEMLTHFKNFALQQNIELKTSKAYPTN